MGGMIKNHHSPARFHWPVKNTVGGIFSCAAACRGGQGGSGRDARASRDCPAGIVEPSVAGGEIRLEHLIRRASHRPKPACYVFPKAAIQLASVAQGHSNKSLFDGIRSCCPKRTSFSAGRPFPGIELIGEQTGISVVQVKREPVTLESMDYPGKQKKGRSKLWRPRE